MKVLVVGGGGREHALVWKIAQSPDVKKVYCAPGNAGIARTAECLSIGAGDLPSLVDFAAREMIDLTLVGPEAPLTMGIVDLFEKKGLRIFGASQKAAEIEGSKAFSKDLLSKYGIPTAPYRTFYSRDEAVDYVRAKGAPICVKADGLAAGKGVFPLQSLDDAIKAIDTIMVEKAFGDAGRRVVIEEFLTGEEASFLAFTDGETVIPFPTSQDHKPIYDGDQGPNTGGMGAYSPAPVVTETVHQEIMEAIMLPTVRAMASEGRKYKGVLYAGLMISSGKLQVLEFNARFGDPEAQPLLMRMSGDLIPVLNAVVDGSLSTVDISWDDRSAVCVVMASEGYPGSYDKGKEIRGLEEVEGDDNVMVFHAGTAMAGDRVVTSGGRVLGVTALGSGVKEAIERAYGAAEKIHWEGVFYRRDIGKKALNRLS